jgi:hypothetical protein
MQYFETLLSGLKKVTELSIAIMALAIILQVLFGPAVPFMPVDVVGNVTKLVAGLGSNGLVGLIAAGMLWAIVSKK